MGLPMEYEAVIINFDSTPADALTFDHVIVRLLNEETRQNSGDGKASRIEVAMSARTFRSTRRPLSEITCFHCQKKGHYQSNCPEKKDPPSDATAATAMVDADDIW